ncbi:RES domain-containing protein [Rheinheimera hassiensis]|uniref:RES domain-containing protein n=1 Tax=Rheinheimera hassiensis TaxID=1193627 RepID=UPI001F06C3B2|nr:RES domain-containing protein [Rheinheimera hassiensis]
MHSIQELYKKAELLRSIDLETADVISLEKQLTDFTYNHTEAAIPRTWEQTWYRARPCENEKKFNNLHEIIYPKGGSDKFGRAQLPQSEVLYASWNLPTALEEINAKRGDLVQLITLRARSYSKIICGLVGQLQYYYTTGRTLLRTGPAVKQIEDISNSPEWLQKLFIDSFIADAFRKKVENNYEYKISAIYAEKLHKAGGGLIFPSVKHAGAMNIAIPSHTFDAKCEVLDTHLIRIVNYFGYGIYGYKCIGYSSVFRANGDIEWISKRQLVQTLGQHNNAIYHPLHMGWRIK